MLDVQILASLGEVSFLKEQLYIKIVEKHVSLKQSLDVPPSYLVLFVWV